MTLVASFVLLGLSQVPAPTPDGSSPSARGAGQLLIEKLDGALETREVADPGEIRFAPDAAVFLRYTGERPKPIHGSDRARGRVELSDGQRWTGAVAGGSGDTLRWTTELGPELKLSVDHVVRIEFPWRIQDLDRAALEPAREGDRLYWVHGDALERVDGTFEAFDDAGVQLTSVLGKRSFPWAEVGALFVAQLTGDSVLDEVSGAPLIVDLADGSRLRAGFAAADARGLVIDYPRAGKLEIPFASLLEAALDDGSIAFLSELAPSKTQEGSLFGDDLGLRWPHRVDRSVVGSPLSVAGQRFARGIGVHAPSRMEWDLGAAASGARKPRTLTGMFGIDDSVRTTSARGSVRFQVHVDGEMRWESGVVRGGESVRALPPIDIGGATHLALVVDPSEDSFVADRANWLRLVLVRAP